jgi:glycerophosphoryl diester phosphodiesterase
VVFVNWSEGAELLFQEERAREQDPVRGLVVARNYERGRLVWLNSCDQGKKLGNSIAKPSDAFVDLLTASVGWVAGLKLLARGAPLIAGHRGVPAIGGENTMVAFRAAIGLEADYIECDIRRTKDGVLVLHHDAKIGDATIAEKPFAELQGAAVAVGRPPARLEDLLKLAKGRIGLDLELKEAGYEAEIAAMIQQCQFEGDRFVVTSFLEEAISQFKQCYKEAVCGLLIGEKSERFSLRAWWNDWFPETRLRRVGADFVAPYDRLVRFGFARRLYGAGYPLWVWTVDNPLRIGELIRTPGVEAVITNMVYVGKREQERLKKH